MLFSSFSRVTAKSVSRCPEGKQMSKPPHWRWDALSVSEEMPRWWLLQNCIGFIQHRTVLITAPRDLLQGQMDNACCGELMGREIVRPDPQSVFEQAVKWVSKRPCPSAWGYGARSFRGISRFPGGFRGGTWGRQTLAELWRDREARSAKLSPIGRLNIPSPPPASIRWE